MRILEFHQAGTRDTSYSLEQSECLLKSSNGDCVKVGNKKAVVIFSKSSCCICHIIKTLICNVGANPTIYELDEHPEGQKIEKELKSLGFKPSVPAVFIGQ
ncbi:monothiol glutaredoxin-S2-like protein [Tanacetum coccineum]